MRERGLVLAITAAIAALVAGVLAVVADAPVLGVVAGAAGVVAGAAAAGIAARARAADERYEAADGERRRLRREIDALTTLLEEEARTRLLHDQAAHEREEATFDEATGLYEQTYFAVLAQQQIAAARRSLRPVSVVIFEVDELSDQSPEAQEQALQIVGDVVRKTLREADAACRLGDLMIGAILEDTPEVGGVWAAERVRGSLLGSPVGDSLTVSAGVSCYPTHALGAAELVSAAGHALEEARMLGADRVEVAPEV